MKQVEDCINYSGDNRDICPKTKAPVTQLDCFVCRPYFEETKIGRGVVHHDCHHPQFRFPASLPNSDETAEVET